MKKIINKTKSFVDNNIVVSTIPDKNIFHIFAFDIVKH